MGTGPELSRADFELLDRVWSGGWQSVKSWAEVRDVGLPSGRGAFTEGHPLTGGRETDSMRGRPLQILQVMALSSLLPIAMLLVANRCLGVINTAIPGTTGTHQSTS